MTDRREEVLNKEFHEAGLEDAQREVTTKPYKAILNAMDEHGKQMSLDFLKFVISKMNGHSVNAAEIVEIKYNGEWLTPEQLFENFL